MYRSNLLLYIHKHVQYIPCYLSETIENTVGYFLRWIILSFLATTFLKAQKLLTKYSRNKKLNLRKKQNGVRFSGRNWFSSYLAVTKKYTLPNTPPFTYSNEQFKTYSCVKTCLITKYRWNISSYRTFRVYFIVVLTPIRFSKRSLGVIGIAPPALPNIFSRDCWTLSEYKITHNPPLE